MTTTLTPGQTFTEGQALPLRILAIEEGYVMARFQGCTPFVQSIEDFEKRLDIAAIKPVKIDHHE